MPAAIDFVAHYARTRPAKIACRDLDREQAYSYGELQARTDRLRAAITPQVGQGDRLVMLSRNRADVLAAQWACIRLGAIFTPLNWRLSEGEIAAQARDCGPSLVVFEDEFESRARACGAPILRLEDASAPPAPPPREWDPDQSATLLYTSGTTGGSKGVIFTETNAFHTCLNFISLAAIGPDSVLLCDAPMFHTIGLYALARSAIQCGATVLFSSRFKAARTYERLCDPTLGVTHYMGAPQMIEALRTAPGFDASMLSRLTGLFSGGAPYPPHKVRAWAQTGVRLAHGYGMSECGTVLCMPLDTQAIIDHAESSGLAGPATQVRLVRPDGSEVEAGEAGEIWLKGPAVSPGYWRNPEATAASRDGEWLRSGDIAWCDPDGFYQVCDRLKDMYISGGENVYPAEVEAVLAAHPGVLEAAVIGVADETWGEIGWAFLVGEVSDEVLIAHCRAHLAGYKLPKRFVRLDALPRTVSGKVQKPLLRQRAKSLS